MAKLKLIILGEYFFQLKLNLYGILLFCKPQSVCQAYAMGIHHNGRLFKNISQNKICGFSSRSGKRQKILHGIGHFTVIYLGYSFAAGFYIFRLVFIKPCRADIFFQFSQIGIRIIFARAVFAKKLFCDNIHPRICALCRQLCGYQHFQRRRIIKRAFNVRVDLIQNLTYSCRFFYLFQLKSPPFSYIIYFFSPKSKIKY